MTKINLEKLSLDALKTLQKDVAKAIAQFEVRKRKEALDAIEAVAREKGYSLSELTGAMPSKRSHTQAPAKYKHPGNPAKTWSGRGRQPAWVKEHLESGKDLDELLIDR